MQAPTTICFCKPYTKKNLYISTQNYTMAIYGIGARYYGWKDMSSEFIDNKIVGIGWDYYDAPDLHEYLTILEPGDIVYIKSCSFSSNITVKGVGFIVDNEIVKGITLSISIGRNVHWISDDHFIIPRPPHQKNNVRNNSIYQEFHPLVIKKIMDIVDADSPF